jgi:menaquinone-9 beta-reductase
LSPEDREVVVAGAGPAGCAAAIFLRQLGHDVLLLDAARFPRDKVCGESVSPEAWRLLDRLGAAGAVRALAPGPVRGMQITAPDGTRFAGRYPQDREPGFALARIHLDAALLAAARAAGVDVREGARVVEALRDGPAVVGVAVAGPEAAPPSRIRGRLVVGADGRHGRVARGLGLLHEHARLRRFAVRGHFEGMQGLAQLGEMHVAVGGYCGVAPLSETRANVAFVLDLSEMRAAGGDLGAFYAETLRRRWPGLHERLARARLLAPPRAIGPLALVARRTSLPGLLLVGDAAGFFDPFTGEGITLALRSAEIAAEVGHARLVGGAPLEEYEARREAATRDKFRVNRLLQRLIGWPSLANAVARRLASRPELANRLVRIAGDIVPAREAFGPSIILALLRN